MNTFNHFYAVGKKKNPATLFVSLLLMCLILGCIISSCSGKQQTEQNSKAEEDRKTITGTFSNLKDTPVRINISKGFAEAPIFGDTTNTNGNFTLYYPDDYKGIGTIEIYRSDKVQVILSGKDFSFTAADAKNISGFTFADDPENDLLKTYLNKELQWLSVVVQTAAITPESEEYKLATDLRTRADADMQQFINAIPNDYYVKNYFKLRQKIQGMRLATQIPSFDKNEYLEVFKSIDLAGETVQSCACSEDILTNAYQIIESQQLPYKDKMKAINKLTDHIMNQVSGDEDQFILAGTFIYNMMETKNYSDANEHLSLLILEGDGCAVDDTKDVVRRFEQYRKMKIGNTAPDIKIDESTTLYNIESANKLVIFWASWCAHCMQEIPRVSDLYPQLKQKDVEVISISLDTDKSEYTKASQNIQWIKYCDFKRWETPAAKDYCVSTTPALFILDVNNAILEKPKGVHDIKRFFKL